MKRKAAIYLRISQDRDGRAEGVRRQEDDCRDIAKARRFTVADVYTDNDKSAWSGKHRPEWDRLLTDAEDGRFQALIAWHDDRLWRNVTEQQLVFQMLNERGIEVIVAGGRDYRTASMDDSVLSGVQALFAQKESADKSRRILTSGRICGWREHQSAIESCKRGLANLDRMTEHEVEMLHMQVEQVIADVRTGDIDKDRANVMLKGLGMLAKLKGFEPGSKVEVQHAHAHAVAVVDDVERFQTLLGEVAAREVQRRQAALPDPDAAPDAALPSQGPPPAPDDTPSPTP